MGTRAAEPIKSLCALNLPSFSARLARALEYIEEGERQLNAFMDQPLIEWLETDSKTEVEAIEKSELLGRLTYPINLQGKQTPRALEYVHTLKRKRRQYTA